MSRIAWFAGVLVLAATLAAVPVWAQSFQGTGQQATELFSLGEGLVVFEAEHRGTGPFSVRLLDERGQVVDEIARATGEFGGSKAVRVPQTGRYLLDVAATGAWSVRRRDQSAAPAAAASGTLPENASPEFTRGWEAGQQQALSVPTGGWLARGVVGGILAGPIGAGFAVGLAGRGNIAVPAVANGGAGDPSYGEGFREGFQARVREQRRKRAFIGGMVGTGVFLAGLVWAIDIAEGGKGGGSSSPPDGGAVFVIVPL